MKTYKQQLHEKMQARIRELRQAIDTGYRLGLRYTDMIDLRKEHGALCNLAESKLSKTQRKKLNRKFSS